MIRRIDKWLPVAALSALVFLACASPPPTLDAAPTAEQRSVARSAGFELSPVLQASQLLPPELLSGPHHRVHAEVLVDEHTHHYWITSEFGDFDAWGDEALRIRLHEVEALAALSQMSKTAEFARAAGQALKSPFVATWNLITNPVDSIVGIPIGAWKKLKQTSALARRERGELEDSGFSELIGFEARKREIASELGVDPYTSNKALQTQLNRFAWAAYAGGLPVLFVPFSDTADTADTSETSDGEDAEARDRLGELLLHYSPEDLRRLNRIELAVMGIPESLSDEFISHSWYSPRHETVLVDALAALDLTAGRSAFIEVAVSAGSEREAHFYQRTTELMRVYSDEVAQIERIVSVDGIVLAQMADGTRVLPLPADHTLWNPRTQEIVSAFRRDPDVDDSRSELLLSGTASALTRTRLEALGVNITENAFESLGARDAASTRAERDTSE